MCIINGPVTSVGATRIYAQPSVDGVRQLTVYSNKVGTPLENLMILPVPNPTTVEFETVPDDFWESCERSFVRTRGVMVGLERGLRGGEPDLEVISHGSYDMVLAAGPGDLWRVPATFAILDADVREFLTREYPTGFGFILCRLKAGVVTYEPFAYSHVMTSNGRLFIPTRHVHRHGPGSPIDVESADWDHLIYTACTTVRAHTSTTRLPSHENRIRWSAMPPRFRLTPAARIHLREITGFQRNEDIWEDRVQPR